jgi:hypothetical protein
MAVFLILRIVVERPAEPGKPQCHVEERDRC